jgi:hypothetical protein
MKEWTQEFHGAYEHYSSIDLEFKRLRNIFKIATTSVVFLAYTLSQRRRIVNQAPSQLPSKQSRHQYKPLDRECFSIPISQRQKES